MKSARSFSSFLVKALLPLLLLGLLAVYFRTYSLHGGPLLAFRSSESLARELVERNMGERVQIAIEKGFPALPLDERMKLVEFQMRKLKSDGRASYDDAIKIATASMERSRKQGGYQYLLEADPYYFLRQTEKLLEPGQTRDFRKGGKYLDLFARAPHGNWTVFLLHPHVGFYWYKILHWLDPQAPLMKVLGILPVFLTLLILPLYAGFGRILRFPLGATWVGVAVLVLSPIFIQRSALGWYDTDPYNYIFPIIILSFVFQGLRDPKWFWRGVLGASFMTGLYSLFWPGWAFIGVLVPASLFGSVAILWTLERSSRDLLKTALRFGGFYILGALVFLAVFLTPEGLKESLAMGWFALNKFALAEFDIWPNIFLTVGEAGSITFRKLVFLTGNYVTFAFGVIGLLGEGFYAIKRHDPNERFRFFFFLLFGSPILLMSLKTERFSVLFVLPLAIFVGFAVTRLAEGGQKLILKIFPRMISKRSGIRGVVLLSMGILFAPMLLLSAHIVALGIKPIMNDVWYKTLLEIKAKTPEEAIIDSWWPPGYFISAIARRRVVVDGGTQYFHVSYWMAKVLMAEDEREAAGILRMINTSGEDALDFLERVGMEVPDAVDLILKIVRLDRLGALSVLPAFLNSEEKEQLLDKTHGRGTLPPTYLLVYDDLVDQNLAVSIVSNWDFRKARSLRLQKEKNGHGTTGILAQDAGKRYIQDLIQASGRWLKYTPIAPLVQKDGSVVSFTNGLRVNLASQDAMIFIPSKGIRGTPASLFFLDQGQLAEKTFSGEVLDASALVFEEDGTYYSVIADARLLRSLLFRLYYLNGKGLSLFKPFLSQGNFQGGTVVRVFELERDKLRG